LTSKLAILLLFGLISEQSALILQNFTEFTSLLKAFTRGFFLIAVLNDQICHIPLKSYETASSWIKGK